MNVSGKTANSTPWEAARSMASQTRSTVPVLVVRSGEIWIAAALIRFILDRPSIDNRGARFLMHQYAIENIQRIDRNNARDEGLFGLSVERLGGESTTINFAAFFHEFCETLINKKMSGESLITEGRKTPLKTKGDPWSIKQDRGLVSFAQQAGGH